ncbi:YtpR family tRNA-binding protein [Spiroplasma tabanidicola]|uniref:tRNA-binding protein n=1 Tax=Spiroplasma tabanidicola TaxID=324079 RepID=A0A6I6CEB4_9MOLU|nr:hypothetical protein [Spiroplasma tabanidicola]QGS52314.1 tRNA-binding protein [Spiroplasma tabanidicola]
MKFFVNYNKNFDVLFVLFENRAVNNTKKVNNIELLFNNDKLIGANIFDPKIDKEKTYRIEDLVLLNYAKQALKEHIKIDNIEAQFVVAKVEECEKIEGTHLSKCKVNNGKEILQIICGANNVKQGLITCLATIGSFMPSGVQILKGSLKGNESYGMLCSGKELKIDNRNINDSGIIELNLANDFLGKSIWEVI